MSSPVSLIPYIVPQVEGRSILDIGCGRGTYGFLLKNLWAQTLAFQKFPEKEAPKYLVGVDIKKELTHSKIIQEIYDQFLVSSADNLPFKDNSFDTILCIEVIEHLEKEKAGEVLDEMERVATKQIIISTPRDPLSKRYLPYRGKYPQVNWPKPDQHKSKTSLFEFKKRGYQTIYSPRNPSNQNPIRFLKFLYLRFFSTNLIMMKKLDKGDSIATRKEKVKIEEVLLLVANKSNHLQGGWMDSLEV